MAKWYELFLPIALVLLVANICVSLVTISAMLANTAPPSFLFGWMFIVAPISSIFMAITFFISHSQGKAWALILGIANLLVLLGCGYAFVLGINAIPV
jgi:hypothetical protein